MVRNHSGGFESNAQGETVAAGLADDQLYRGLAASNRRRLLYFLLTDGPATVDELATLLAGWQTTDTGRMVTPAKRERILTELVHVHLPLLTEAGLVVYDDPRDTIEAGPLDSAVRDLVHDSVRAESVSRP